MVVPSGSRPTAIPEFWLSYAAVALTAVLLYWCGLIPGWGAWYSTRLDYREQTDALLQGRTGLSTNVLDMKWDQVWDNGVSQQVWGLGVPAWRLPFEALARLLGKPSFPDRIAFGIALALVLYSVMKFHRQMSSNARWILALPLMLSPYYLTLFSSRFIVYEEAVGYELVVATLFLVWTLCIWERPTALGFSLLSLAAGLSPFIRPTLVFYGMASIVVAGSSVWRRGPGFKWMLLGGACYAAGVGLLLWSNAGRFGGPLEFGHSLNINDDPAMRYASRFAAPFWHAPVLPAARELFSLLFVTRTTPKGWHAYDRNMFWGQADGFRWRAFGLDSYGPICAAILLIVWFWWGWRVTRTMLSQKRSLVDSLVPAVGWSFLGGALLFAFYFRCPFISSRYLLDFAPSFTVAVWAFWRLMLRLAERLSSRHRHLPKLTLVGLCGWWLCAVALVDKARDSYVGARDEVVAQVQAADEHPAIAPPTTASTNLLHALGEVASLHLPPPKVIRPIPECYTNGFDFSSTGIMFNGSGWESNGVTKASVALFVRDPEGLLLDVAPKDGKALPAASYDCIQAKIGLEFLRCESITPTREGMSIVFRGPQRRRYQTGIQVAFLGMVPVGELSAEDSKFRLLKVSWHREAKAGATNQLYRVDLPKQPASSQRSETGATPALRQ